MSTELTTTIPGQELATRTPPSIGELQERLAKAKEFLQTALEPAKLTGPYKDRHDGDYGVIPGCGDKPVLFKSGAEKLARLFDLQVVHMNRTMFERIDVRHELLSEDDPGVPGFMLAYACSIAGPGGQVWGNAEAFTSHDELTFHEYSWQGSGDSRRRTGFKGLAPLNTLAARAQKRAYVRAVVQALGITSLVSTHDGAVTSELLTEDQRAIVAELYQRSTPRMVELAMRQAAKVKQSAWPNFLGAAVDTAADVHKWSDTERERVYKLLDAEHATAQTVAEVFGDEVVADADVTIEDAAEVAS